MDGCMDETIPEGIRVRVGGRVTQERLEDGSCTTLKVTVPNGGGPSLVTTRRHDPRQVPPAGALKTHQVCQPLEEAECTRKPQVEEFDEVVEWLS